MTASAMEACIACGVDHVGLNFVPESPRFVDFDTAALALLLHARRLAAQRGQAFELRDAPTQLRQLARLYGVDALLQLDAAG